MYVAILLYSSVMNRLYGFSEHLCMVIIGIFITLYPCTHPTLDCNKSESKDLSGSKSSALQRGHLRTNSAHIKVSVGIYLTSGTYDRECVTSYGVSIFSL